MKRYKVREVDSYGVFSYVVYDTYTQTYVDEFEWLIDAEELCDELNEEEELQNDKHL